MSSLSIKRPIGLDMDVVETDDHLPSIKMSLILNIDHPTGKILYQANDIWFNCREWDDFVWALKNIYTNNSRVASLENLSNNLKIVFTTDNNIIRLNFSVEEDDSKGATTLINYFSSIDDDLFSQIRNKFIEFEKWW